MSAEQSNDQAPTPAVDQNDDSKPKYNEVQKELIKVATFLQKNGLKEKEAVANRKRVYYFRADCFHELVLEHNDEILTLLSKHNQLEKLDDIDDSKLLGDLFINNGLMKSYDRIPDDVKKYKYPKKLRQVTASMNDQGFYSFDIFKSQTKMAVLAGILAVSIIAIILFPLWPYTVKLAIFNILFYFSASIIGLAVVRLLLYIVLFPFGIDFWIFPNMFDDDASILESFVPLLLINRREDGWLVFFLRVMMIVIFGLYCYQEAGLPLPIDSTFEIVDEIFEWGKDKMVGNETTQLQFTGKGHHSLDDILKMTEEYEEEERLKKEQEEETNPDQEEHHDVDSEADDKDNEDL